jgi:hypothetical protein
MGRSIPLIYSRTEKFSATVKKLNEDVEAGEISLDRFNATDRAPFVVRTPKNMFVLTLTLAGDTS